MSLRRWWGGYPLVRKVLWWCWWRETALCWYRQARYLLWSIRHGRG